MCGILGSIPGAALAVDLLAHRGPDGRGATWMSEVSMGHARLSILDLTGRGAQPRWSEDGRVLLSYNGEIYNFKEIGTAGKTSDTVALAEWLARTGSDFDLAELDGMYAFAAYFLKDKCLALCRDPVGVKPLYLAFCNDGDTLGFASELKGLFGIEWFRAEPVSDQDVHSDFLQYGYTFPRMVRVKLRGQASDVELTPTLLKDVYQVCPGQKLLVSRDGRIAWTRTQLGTHDRDPISLLDESVRAQSMSDVEVGVQLSGGFDSSLVAHRYVSNNPHVHGFYVSVRHPRLNEDSWAHHAAKKLSLLGDFTFHEIVADRDALERVMPSVIWHMDEPAVRHPNAVGVYLLCQYVRAKTNVEVLLTGEGADELFGGYEWHDGLSMQDYDRSRRLFDLGGSGSARRYIAMNPDKPLLERQLIYDKALYLPPILARQDRMSMAHSIESRVPFLSNAFLALPAPTKAGKWRIKEEAARIFGREFADRKKCGFGFPWEWLGAVSLPKGSLSWMKIPFKPRNDMQRWTLAALGRWSDLYVGDGWRSHCKGTGTQAAHFS